MTVPLFERLSVTDILEWAKKYPQVQQALPSEEREIEKLLRQYVINIVYTIDGPGNDIILRIHTLHITPVVLVTVVE